MVVLLPFSCWPYLKYPGFWGGWDGVGEVNSGMMGGYCHFDTDLILPSLSSRWLLSFWCWPNLTFLVTPADTLLFCFWVTIVCWWLLSFWCWPNLTFLVIPSDTQPFFLLFWGGGGRGGNNNMVMVADILRLTLFYFVVPSDTLPFLYFFIFLGVTVILMLT